jgi:hypothetical protein
VRVGCEFSSPDGSFFVYGFAKSYRANINDNEEEQFKQASKHVLALKQTELAELLKRGDFIEVEV